MSRLLRFSTVFCVFLSERGAAPERMIFEIPEITIGRVDGNDIVLPKGNISKRHARCVFRDGKHIIVDLKSTNGTFVNNRRITSPLVIHEDDVIVIGDYTLSIGSIDNAFDDDVTVEADPTELRLLSAIAARDDATRVVYADWLEEHGHAVRAEFLRLQQGLVGANPDDRAFADRVERLRELAAAIDIRWRYKVARPAIEGCHAVEVRCPKEWGALAATERSNLRSCSACTKRVVYCATVAEARRHVARGNSVAIDIVPQRRPGDLERDPPMVLGRMVARSITAATPTQQIARLDNDTLPPPPRR